MTETNMEQEEFSMTQMWEYPEGTAPWIAFGAGQQRRAEG